ncbi:hypothetical protein CJU89_6071 [Yarrowia sp. B02]|nr:hypothetical protein CJU89_6071 [Yarrowia sp. B02]
MEDFFLNQIPKQHKMTPDKRQRYPELEIALQNFVRRLPDSQHCDTRVINEMRDRMLATKFLPVVPDYRELCSHDDPDDTTLVNPPFDWKQLLDLTSLDDLLPGGEKQLIQQYEQVRVRRFLQSRTMNYAYGQPNMGHDFGFNTPHVNHGMEEVMDKPQPSNFITPVRLAIPPRLHDEGPRQDTRAARESDSRGSPPLKKSKFNPQLALPLCRTKKKPMAEPVKELKEERSFDQGIKFIHWSPKG